MCILTSLQFAFMCVRCTVHVRSLSCCACRITDQRTHTHTNNESVYSHYRRSHRSRVALIVLCTHTAHDVDDDDDACSYRYNDVLCALARLCAAGPTHRECACAIMPMDTTSRTHHQQQSAPDPTTTTQTSTEWCLHSYIRRSAPARA